MSATRILHRRQFMSEAGSGYRLGRNIRRAQKQLAKGLPAVLPDAPEYHVFCVAKKYRHPDFQKRARLLRKAHGLSPTSGNMHRIHGRAV